MKTLKSIMVWINRRLEARKTYQELTNLSDRELLDIGLTRNNISSIAYGQYFIR